MPIIRSRFTNVLLFLYVCSIGMSMMTIGPFLKTYNFLYCLRLISALFFQWNRTLTDLDLKRRKADKREKERMQIPFIEKLANPTLGFEVENFKMFGSLRKTVTEIHNTVPSYDSKHNVSSLFGLAVNNHKYLLHTMLLQNSTN